MLAICIPRHQTPTHFGLFMSTSAFVLPGAIHPLSYIVTRHVLKWTPQRWQRFLLNRFPHVPWKPFSASGIGLASRRGGVSAEAGRIDAPVGASDVGAARSLRRSREQHGRKPTSPQRPEAETQRNFFGPNLRFHVGRACCRLEPHVRCHTA